MRYRIVRDDADGKFYVEWFGKAGLFAFLRGPRWLRMTGSYHDCVYDLPFATEEAARAYIVERERRANAGVTVVADIEAH
ncbi:hypothetical protein [Aureimonas sp. AU12]|uniref:hypothetical protein n=1 Tax=Aureimonas sp. AU12 TaxID=1638161 RepID=UPI0007803131|nr:hypothetical protein [Aureimonas sp. AU12]